MPLTGREHREDPDDRDVVMAMHGDTVAWGLCEGFDGAPDAGTGWRGGLQDAADTSDQDPEILQIADEIHMGAHLRCSVDAIAGYADRARNGTSGPLADWFLLGMLHHLEQRGTGSARPDRPDA